jgi:LacI family transcriptional regulator
MRRTTIQDVAQKAGVGKVTVSYVLNGRAQEFRISEETSHRVRRAAAELQYHPHALGQMLARRCTNTLGVVFQGVHHFAGMSSFICEVLQGVCEESVQQGFDVMLHTRESDGVGPEAGYLTSGRLDGALLLRDSDDPLPPTLQKLGFPIVVFFNRPEEPGIPYVDSDNFVGGRLAAQHLLSLGHTRIGALRGPRKSGDANDRQCGFSEALRAADVQLRDEDVLDIYSHVADFSEFVAMMSRPERPTAIFVWADDVAFKCIQILSTLGLRVPEDVSIIGYDSTAACATSTPPLTSVRQPIAQMAKMATRMLVEQIRGPQPDLTQIVLPPQLDIRASTAPPIPYSTQRRGIS